MHNLLKRFFYRWKRILLPFYEPSVYVGFNEGISEVLFPRKKVLRLVFGWKPLAVLLRSQGIFSQVYVNSRIVEVPHFFMGLATYGRHVSSILDFGCVESKISVHLANLGYLVTAVDLRNYKFKSIHRLIKYIQGDIFRLDLKETYDLIIAISTVEHVGLEAYGAVEIDVNGDRRVMRKLKQLLNPGGLLYLTVPYGLEYKVLPGSRIYDAKTLELLIEGFEVLEKWIYVRYGNEWFPSTNDTTNEAKDEMVAILWLRVM